MAIAYFDSNLNLRASKEKYRLLLSDINDVSTQQDLIVETKEKESFLSSVLFNIFKFNNRPKPSDRKRVLIISCFSEFGCETLGCMYCIPRLLKKTPGLYVIGIGWHGREFLYRNLVDEFWEIDESLMWLRDYCRAFHHISTNLKRIEESACRYGTVVPSSVLGRYFVGNLCHTCGKFWNQWKTKITECPNCKSTVITKSILGNVSESKKLAYAPPKIRSEIIEWANGLIKQKTVGVFARGRKTYGRNLPESFYLDLIKMLKNKGYDVVWMGEKQNILPCPDKGIFDFSKTPEARDLEKTLAIISKLSFTIQFWTASTRLAGMVGTPFLLFESPDQIYSYPTKLGQEGKRIELSTFGEKKLCIADYELCYNDLPQTLHLAEKCIEDMEQGDFSDVEGLIEDLAMARQQKKEYYASI